MLINQRVFSLAERYDVLDTQGMARFHVVRELPLAGMMAAGVVRMVFSLFCLAMAFLAFRSGHGLLALFCLWSASLLGEAAYLLVVPFRHIFISIAGFATEREKGAQAPPVLSLSQDTKMPWERRFTLFDEWGQPVAQFKKNQFSNFLRRRWRIFTPGGELICEAVEDTWVRSIARRLFGTFWGLLKTDFYFYDSYGVLLGYYTRRWTLLDRYVLDLRADPWRRLDRRVALGAGILLDTGERR